MTNNQKLSPQELLEKLSILEEQSVNNIESFYENDLLDNLEDKINKADFSETEISNVLEKINNIQKNVAVIKENLNQASQDLMKQKANFSKYNKSASLLN